ncbi:hypothetical protein [Aliiroseovarius sp. F20344]|uniref:hypothetical protein n=1 Tax=Aliiroseovarius sp. F20344 TaxID=2926414 RepID=UPI001FF24EC7|nr:hypothetical protein [Aliiroseovarius sp. F20344]MCK0143830.1 hypothetical protein [Aliiroseovarius sp. F20344]
MPIRITQHIFRLFFLLVLLPVGTPAFANSTEICNSIAVLKRVEQRITSEIGFTDQLAALSSMKKLSARLKLVKQTNNSYVDRPTFSNLSSAVVSLDRTLVNVNTMVPSAIQDLTDLVQDLQKLEPVFGCSEIRRVDTQERVISLSSMDRPREKVSSIISGDTSITLGVSMLALMALICLSAVIVRWSFAERAARLVCRTPLLLVQNGNCSMSNILDINRSGMKVEAAPEHVERNHVELYFCGHKTSGQVRWKNSYFAGIQFNRKISPQVLKDVVDKSGASLEESGLQSNAKTCFSVDCHKTCPQHNVTEISRQLW